VTAVVTTEGSIEHIFKTCDEYGKASGSKLNKNKTKGLWMGAWADRKDKPYDMEWSTKLKICGCWFGVGFSPHELWKKMHNEVKIAINFNKLRSLSYTGKVGIINVMTLSKLWYICQSMSVPPMLIHKLNKLIFNYFWGDTYEPISRNTLYQTKISGGLNIVNIEAKITAFHLQHLQKLITSNAKWTYFAVYWIGLTLRQYNAEFAANNRPHTLDFTQLPYVGSTHSMNNV
jgi:hypothetical protein